MSWFDTIKENKWFILAPIIVATLFKPLTPFYDGLGEREVSLLSTLLAGNNLLFAAFSILLGCLFLYTSFREVSFKQIPILSKAQKTLIFLKLYLLFNSLFKNEVDVWIIEDLQALIITILLCFIVQQIGVVRSGLNHLLAMLFSVGCLFLSLNLIEILINPAGVSFGGRLFGVMPQPNTLGISCALFSVITLYTFYSVNGKLNKTFAVFMFILSAFMVLASGSRASLAVMIIGLFIYLLPLMSITKIVKFLVFLLFFILLLFLFVSTIDSDIFNFSRLASTQDTRDVTKEIFRDAFFSAPFFGVGNFIEATANSYFVVMVKGGVFGVTIFSIAIMLTFVSIIKQFELYWHCSIRRCFVSLFIMLTAGGVYEGYLIDNLSFTSILYLIILSLLTHANPNIK